jgi:hypothetical protein
MKTSLNILLFLFAILTCNSQSSELEKFSIEKNDSISFKRIGFNSYHQIILHENNEFIRTYSSVGCYPGDKSNYEQHFGTFELKDSIVILKPKTVELNIYTNGVTENKRLEYEADSSKIETEFKILKYKGQQFLIPLDSSDVIESKFEQNEKQFRKMFLLREI